MQVHCASLLTMSRPIITNRDSETAAVAWRHALVDAPDAYYYSAYVTLEDDTIVVYRKPGPPAGVELGRYPLDRDPSYEEDAASVPFPRTKITGVLGVSDGGAVIIRPDRTCGSCNTSTTRMAK